MLTATPRLQLGVSNWVMRIEHVMQFDGRKHIMLPAPCQINRRSTAQYHASAPLPPRHNAVSSCTAQAPAASACATCLA